MISSLLAYAQRAYMRNQIMTISEIEQTASLRFGD
jgi:hypothetical protein